MENWANDGTIPSSITYDLKKFFELRKKRLDKLGLNIELNFEPYFFEYPLSNLKEAKVHSEIYKAKEMMYRDYKRTIKYKKIIKQYIVT